MQHVRKALGLIATALLLCTVLMTTFVREWEIRHLPPDKDYFVLIPLSGLYSIYLGVGTGLATCAWLLLWLISYLQQRRNPN